jgi:uncharacterized membrane protein (UPF0127 family)
MNKFLLFLFIASVVACENGAEKSSDDGKSPSRQTYEPKFKKEGELAFLTADKDSLDFVLDIEIAKTAEEQAYGMMYRKSIPEYTGMLFLRQKEERQSFWMRNTFVPLDLIYIRSDSSIVNIVADAVPLSDQSLPSDGPALYVLEVEGGFCAQHGITAGFFVRFKDFSEG